MGLPAYAGLEAAGYRHEASVLLGKEEDAAVRLLPRVHRVASLLKRWLLGTHQGAVSPEHFDYYLDEFTFRFNRRRSASRGKLFYRLIQQAVQVAPVPYKFIVGGNLRPQPIVVGGVKWITITYHKIHVLSIGHAAVEWNCWAGPGYAPQGDPQQPLSRVENLSACRLLRMAHAADWADAFAAYSSRNKTLTRAAALLCGW